jgi:siroheme synthase-like protein
VTGEHDATSGQAATHYPVTLDLRGRRCLVVGGGNVARRKVDGLLAAGAFVTVVAPRCLPMPDNVHVETRAFEDADLLGSAFVVAASDDAVVNAQVAREARRRDIWVNVADDAAAGTAILPAVARRGALQIAISTGGASPALARRLREQIEAEYGPEWAEVVALLDALRSAWEPRAIAAGVPSDARRAAWHAVLDLPLAELIHAGRAREASERARQVLERALADPPAHEPA